MNDIADFISRICQDPKEDTHRLVFADWLEEHQHLEEHYRDWSRFIRLQVEVSCKFRDNDIPSVQASATEADVILRSQPRLAWAVTPLDFLPGFEKSWRQFHHQVVWQNIETEQGMLGSFDRGLIGVIDTSLEFWLLRENEIRSALPVTCVLFHPYPERDVLHIGGSLDLPYQQVGFVGRQMHPMPQHLTDLIGTDQIGPAIDWLCKAE